jgi:UDP-3-O-[3-hydroxymyristoyl] glucosamine N-acyltransferase
MIGDGTFIAPLVETTRGVVIGKRCLIESDSFICDGLRIGDDVERPLSNDLSSGEAERDG